MLLCARYGLPVYPSEAASSLVHFCHRLRRQNRVQCCIAMFQTKRLSTARLCATRYRQVLARRTAQVIATAAVVGLLTGCQSIAGNTTPSRSFASLPPLPDAPGLDIYAGTGALAYNLGFGTITSYVPITAGTYVINADTAGTTQVLSTTKVSLADSSEYTDLIGNSRGEPAADNPQGSKSGRTLRPDRSSFRRSGHSHQCGGRILDPLRSETRQRCSLGD